MYLIGVAFLGVLLGAVGTEILRASKPELVSRTERYAKRLVDFFSSAQASDNESKEE